MVNAEMTPIFLRFFDNLSALRFRRRFGGRFGRRLALPRLGLRGGRGRLGFRRLLLLGRAACIVGDVEAAALEDQAGPAADQALQALLLALWALREPLILHRLKFLKMISAFGTFVLVGRHGERERAKALGGKRK